MKYFLHDSNSFNDEKITELYLKFGYEGLGLFYTILEKLASQEKPIKTIVLKAQLKVGKKLEKCWLFMEQIELISSNNGDTFNKQLLNFSEKYNIKKEKNTKRISEWRKNQEDSENVTCYERVSNTTKVKESKVNKSKVNIIPEIPLEFTDEKVDNVFITKNKKELKGKRLETFLIFWDKFNYKKGKAEAADSWLEIPQLTELICQKIYIAAENESKNRDALIQSGKTPKMAQGWITARRWEDEVNQPKQKEKKVNKW